MVSGTPRARFRLTDHHGRTVSEDSFAGHFLLVYFGFTNCKLVCPRSLGKMSQVLDDMGEQAAMITALYITVDPDRDTPEAMRAYLEPRYPRFLGLTGPPDKIDEAKKAFRVFAERKADPGAPGGYVVPHSAISYLMSPGGQYCDHFTDAVDGLTIATRIRRAIASWQES